MSREAERVHQARQQWAVPGSKHDRVVRMAKIGLPISVGLLVLFLALAPLDKDSDVSFILDKNKVENAPERMRVEAARYSGEDNEGRRFEIVARSALQRSSEVPIVDISGMFARMWLANGPVTIAANLARYNLDRQEVRVVGPIRASGPDGYRLETSDVTIDLKERTITGSGQLTGRMRLGTFSAGRLTADLGERTITLDHGARLKIVQGAVR
jgi:lipopolysaccharide export system protein LptC